MKKQFALLFVIALSLVPALVADNHLDGLRTVQYDALLSPSHQSPPIEGADVSGNARVEVTVTREAGEIVSAIFDFHVNWRAGQPEELRAMHIHRGAAGANGSVVVDTALGAQPASMGSMIFRSATVTDVELIKEIMANPSGFYLNVHSVSSGRGIIRGQLMMDAASRLRVSEERLQKSMADLDALIRSGFNFPPKQ
jgi:CHRD domain-containing protein